MAAWQFVAGPALGGGYDLALHEARARKLGFRLTEPSSVSFTLDGHSEEADVILELATDLHVLCDEQPVYRGRVGATSDDIGGGTHRVDVRTHDYRELLERRHLYDEDQLLWENVDQSVIAWNLIQQTQAHPGGSMGISPGIGAVSGIIRTREYKAGDSVGQRIQELSEVIDGFDWDVTPVGQSALHLDVWFPLRGTDRGEVLEYGGAVRHVRREVDPGEYANSIQVTGEEGLLVEEREASDLADPIARPEGRWDGVYGEQTIKRQSTLEERCRWQLAVAQVIQPTYTLTLKPGAWPGPDHMWLGDTVQIRLASGRVNVDTPLRIYEIDVTLGQAGEETVQVTVGGPKPNFKVRPSRFLRRLRDLERR